MKFSIRHISLTTLTALSLTALLVVSSAYHFHRVDYTPTAASDQAASWDILSRNANLRDAEAAYRACSHEAALFQRPLKEFPEVSERVTYLTQDGKRFRKSESVTVDIDGMGIDNGCATRIVKGVSINVIGSNAQPRITIDESGRSVLPQNPRKTLRPNEASIQRAIASKALPTQACALTRDPGPQSHFMMLNLCRSEERRAELEQKRQQEPRLDPYLEPKKARTSTKTS